ncbi:carbohydrate-binding protein [Fibrobacter sp. UBA3718]|uniref:carbohydrate-binding protein n=1 Tax=Fibrobacter sp. UBA3718 TaxID=1946531 RepID=UPI0025BC8261|nr:carbohydrate-binding protein [Fibrobacter sp. UBA3718]
MKKSFMGKFGLAAVCGLAASALADNPISSYHYLADPGAAADDTYFYVITDSDDPAAANANGYNIKALYGFRTKDMKNWTDFGIIYDARKVDGIGDIWASGIAVNPNDHRLYIVFPDGGGGGIGLIGADSIAGPWTNPVSGNKKLINNWGGGISDCDGIGWCFDPAIFFDDDGTGYFTFGGGSSDSRPANNNNNDIFNIYKLNKDMKGFDVSTKTHLKIGGPKAMEASYIHKYKGNYYLSYSTADLRIAYGMSKNPMGPYEYKGIFMGNPNINGQNINANNNNHHGIAEFKGHWYVAYHDRRIANGYDGLEKIPADDGQANPVPAYHRSVSVDEFFYNNDGTMKELTFTKEGPKQIENFDPYDWYPALTSSKQKGIRSRSNWTPGKVAEHLLLPLSTKESWIRVSGVDFGTAATGFVVQAASTADGDKVEIHTGSATGTLAGTCTLKNTGNKNTFAENSCEVTGLKGIVEQVFLVFKGSRDSTMAIKAWGFEGSGTTPPEPQKPFGGKAWAVPGKIEAENFDEPGTGRGGDVDSYNESDSENHGDSDYRDGTGVDLYKKATGIIVGYNTEGEWLEYTINVAKEGDYTLYAAVAAAGSTSSFKFSLDGTDITEEITVPAATEGEENYDDYNKVKANIKLPAGEHVLRLTVVGSWFDIDYFNILEGKDAEDTEPISTDAIETGVAFKAVPYETYRVFDLKGAMVGKIRLDGATAGEALRAAGFNQGVYMLRSLTGNKKFMVNTAK